MVTYFADQIATSCQTPPQGNAIIAAQLAVLHFFLLVSDNRVGFEHKLIFLRELLTLHAQQLVLLTQRLHTAL